MITFKQPKVDIARQYLSKLTPQPKVLVELGGYVGKSAIAWGDMFRSFHPDGSAKVFSCELEEKFVGIITDFIDIAGLQGTVKVLQGPSGESLRSLRQKEGVDFIDVLFLDHWEECYLPDLKTCEELRLLRVGSVVLADNVDMPGAPEYLKYVEGDGEGGWKYRCETMLVDGPENIPVSFCFSFVWYGGDVSVY